MATFFTELDFSYFNWWTLLTVAYLLYVLATAIWIIMENRAPAVTLAWILSFIALPIVGVVLYIFLGRKLEIVSERLQLIPQTTQKEITAQLAPLIESQLARVEALRDDINRSPVQRRLLNMVQRTGLSALTDGNQVELLINAQNAYPQLIEDIENAATYVHLEYYTFETDDFMQDFCDRLIRKVQEGVEVRILFDAIGSVPLLFRKRSFLRYLRDNGIKIHSYLNFLGLYRLHTVNYRNHRKIAVIDGKVGYTGGLNLGEEYLYGAEPYDAWRDTHLRLRGDAVSILAGIFTTSWYNTTRERLSGERYFPQATSQTDEEKQHPISTANSHHESEDTPLQIVLSGPDSEWRAIQQLYFLMILSAQKRVRIQSPFFIPSTPISEALRVAALSGIEVELMFALKDTGSPLPNWAANTYYADMAEAGASIYLYRSAYLHAKTVSVDETVCCVGTANMDIRSFAINYEMTALVYDKGIAQALEECFTQDIENCVQFDLAEYRRRPTLLRLRDSLARLCSPLL